MPDAEATSSSSATSSPRSSASSEALSQRPFGRVAPLLSAALLLGVGGGFALATLLTLTRALQLPIGVWWTATAQAHGHLQIYGWAGLFVLGVAFHFLPRLRGAPLAAPGSIPWVLGSLVGGLTLRAVSQPLVAVTGAGFWRGLLVVSGLLECAALWGAVLVLGATARRGPPLPTRPALWSILPFVVGAYGALAVASGVNLVNVIQAARAPTGLVPVGGDTLNVTLGLLGFLVPMGLAMSARSLPMYAGLDAFPRTLLRPLAWAYLGGLVLLSVGSSGGNGATRWWDALAGLGMCLLGGVVIAFVVIFLWMMRRRGRLPERVARLAHEPGNVARAYERRVANERDTFGPFPALIASAYLWALFGASALIVDGLARLFGAGSPISLDALRHSVAIGFIALLLCGVAPRMIPGFSGGRIASPHLVSATLWLGNAAVLLRVGSLLLAPALAAMGATGLALDNLAFGLSGPLGLALAICLLVNLWPALWPAAKTAA